MILLIFSVCVLLGAVVGFAAGLLGIGGGLLIVPALVYLLPLLDVEAALVMPMALATSLATIVVTTSSAALAHHKNKNIEWTIAKQIMVSIGLGSLLGAFIADELSVSALKNTFAVAVIILSSYMFFSLGRAKHRAKKQVKAEAVLPERVLPNAWKISTIGFLTGILASLMGIAGGAILVPILSFFGVTMRHAIGISSVSGIIVAIFGVTGYVITGYSIDNLPDYSIGYVYLPALIGIILTSSFFAPIGVSWASKLPVTTLKKCFAVFLMLVAVRMMIN